MCTQKRLKKKEASSKTKKNRTKQEIQNKNYNHRYGNFSKHKTMI